LGTPPTLTYRSIINELGGETAFTYLAKAKELMRRGVSVVNFGIGQPDIPTFDVIIEAAKEALNERFTGYTETAGIYELRKAISDYLAGRYSVDVKPSEIIVTPGAKCAIFMAVASYLGSGDEIIIPEPSFPAYSEVAKFVGARPVFIPLKWLGPERGFELDLELIESSITDRTRMIVINNPHNPTGALFSKRQVEEVMEIARRRGIIVLADEIYDSFIYDGAEFKSFLTFPEWRDNIIYINGFSKTFSMTGWRLGYIIAREEVTSRLVNLAVNIYSCATSFAQKAAIAALQKADDNVKEMVNLFKRRRDLIASKLREIPEFDVWPSRGAFYIFPNISKLLNSLNMGVEEFVNYLLMNHGVVVLPGTAFPDKVGRDYIRISFAVNFSEIEEGVRRIKECINKLKGMRG